MMIRRSGGLWRTFEGQVDILRFDEVGHRESRSVIKEKGNIKLVFVDN